MITAVSLDFIKKEIENSPIEMMKNNTSRLFIHYLENNYHLQKDEVEKINSDLKIILKKLIKTILIKFGDHPTIVRDCIPKLYKTDKGFLEFTKKDFYKDVKKLIYYCNTKKFGDTIDREVGKTLKMRKEIKIEEGSEKEIKIFKIRKKNDQEES